MGSTPWDAGTVPPDYHGYYLSFDGAELVVHGPDGRAELSIPAISGRPGTSAVDQDKKNFGPIPSGTYTLDISNFLPHPPGGLLTWGDWGQYHVPITPAGGTDTHGRSGFNIHGGIVRGSAGCIDVGPGDKELYEFLQGIAVTGTIYVTVNYDNPDAFNWSDLAWDPAGGMPKWGDLARPHDDETGPVVGNADTPAEDDGGGVSYPGDDGGGVSYPGDDGGGVSYPGDDGGGVSYPGDDGGGVSYPGDDGGGVSYPGDDGGGVSYPGDDGGGVSYPGDDGGGVSYPGDDGGGVSYPGDDGGGVSYPGDDGGGVSYPGDDGGGVSYPGDDGGGVSYPGDDGGGVSYPGDDGGGVSYPGDES